MKRAVLAIAVLAILPLLAVKADGQTLSSILRPFGVAGSIVDTDDNAFGIGFVGTVRLPWTGRTGVKRTSLSFKLFAVGDLEAIQRELKPGFYRDWQDDEFFYYRCATTELHSACTYVGQAVEPYTAEADTRYRAYGAAYLVGDLWRIRLGGGFATREERSGLVPSMVVGFATTAHTWVVWEKPAAHGWRLRFEFHAREHLW